jgi:hypothetical protein
MPFSPQNFINGGGPAIGAAWLNALDVTANSVLAGAQNVPAALTALGLTAASLITAVPVTIAQGGTGQTTAANALTALGGITPAASQAQANTAQANAIATSEAFTTTSLVPYALLASPTFTGVPAAPTAALGTNTTQLATMAAVLAGTNSVGATGTLAASKSSIAVPVSGSANPLLLQFGTGGAGASITYLTAFTTAAFVFIYPVSSETTGLTAQSLTGFTYTVGGGVGVYWFAIGY